ncbi:MAG TPA: pyridine nucleotide-disulfide oxidoreductase [Deltaproteobacteria bacterium]|nr:pyridine nucleotide-disulfide oxidoreductase [Deltaproteobacteria bacterium]
MKGHSMEKIAKIVVVGGGTGGITVAARLRRKSRNLKIVLIEPSDKHYYQPLWTLVGAGVVKAASTLRKESDFIPSGVEWIREKAVEFRPAENWVRTESGAKVDYDFLVVAPGIQINLAAIPGLQQSLGQGSVGTIYFIEQAPKVWEMIRRFRGGRAVFTQPSTPIKCGGAPQKIMYLAEEYFQKSGVRKKSEIIFAKPGNSLFGIQAFLPTLQKVVQRKEIQVNYHHDLTKIDPENRKAHFKVLQEDASSREEILDYDFLHVVPPMSAPDCVKNSPLAATEGPHAGWLDVDIHTLQHKRFPNVFGIGDAAGLPTGKTGAAIRKQAPVLVHNLWQLIQGQSDQASWKSYGGYASCPFVTGYGKVFLAEFDYSGKPAPSFPLDPTKERYSMWLLKRYFLPFFYWHGMLRGLA